jgi:hypothetical protein
MMNQIFTNSFIGNEMLKGNFVWTYKILLKKFHKSLLFGKICGLFLEIFFLSFKKPNPFFYAEMKITLLPK